MQRTLVAAALLGTLILSAPANTLADEQRDSKAKKIYRGQVLMNSQVTVVTSPQTTDDSEWIEDTGWNTPCRAESLLVLVQISPGLIDASVDYWAEGRDVSRERVQDAKQKLRAQFLPEGQKAFLLLAKPAARSTAVVTTPGLFGKVTEVKQLFHHRWKLKLGPIADNLRLVTLGGDSGKVARSEQTLDGAITAADKLSSCFVFVEDVVPSTDGRNSRFSRC